MKTTKANEIKNQIKVNFESMTFEAAMSANAELFKEYEEIKGKRSLTSLISYYRSKAKATVEPEENLEPVNEPEATEIPVKESEGEETVTLSIGNISRDWVKSFLESNQPSKESFCIVREYYFCKSDTETVRNTRLFVKPDGSGYSRWDDANEASKEYKLTSFRKIGSFDASNEGLPVGEQYCRVSILRVKNALQKFVIDRQGATQIVKVESIETELA